MFTVAGSIKVSLYQGFLRMSSQVYMYCVRIHSQISYGAGVLEVLLYIEILVHGHGIVIVFTLCLFLSFCILWQLSVCDTAGHWMCTVAINM